MERVTNPNVVGYEVLASSLAVFGVIGPQRRIAVIPNPKNINPIKIRTKLQNPKALSSDIYSRFYSLKHKSIIVNQDYNIKVIINGAEVDKDLYVLNIVNSQLIIYIVISEQDIVEVEYYIDGVEYEFISENDERYVVRPITDETNSFIGRHNVLV